MRALVLLPLAALALAACGERAEPLAGDLEAYPVTVRDAAGDPVRAASRPERIVALSAGAAEIVGALGAAERLVGVPSGTLVPGASGATSVVRPSGIVDPDALRALRPDLVVAPGDAATSAVEDAAEDAAVYLQPDRSVADIVRAVLDLGFLVGEPVRGRRVATRLRDAVARVDRRVRGRPAVRVFVDTGFFVPADPESLVAALVRRAGGDPVDPGSPAGLDACAVLALEPEVLLRIRDPAPRPLGVDFDACPPGPRPRLAELDTALATTAGPGIAEALDAIADRLHGDG